MSKVDEVFNLFSRCRGWHSAWEIAGCVSLSESAVMDILNYLAKFDLVEYDRQREVARVAFLGRKVHGLK